MIIWQQDNRWKIMPTENIPAVLLPHSLVFPWLTILNFRLASGRRRSVMIFADAMDAETFRRLRVRLKVSAKKLFKKTSLSSD
jgi:toxin CptA